MSKKILISAIIILVVFGSGLFLLRQPTIAPTKNNALQDIAGAATEAIIPSPTPVASPLPTVNKTMEFDKTKKYQVALKTTAGDIVIELSPKTPITSKNFFDLVNKKYYDGVIFHRVISGFMIQGGDPTGTGAGGPGYKFDDEQFEGEYTRGTVAMANAGPNTNGSQFFIMHKDYRLPKNYVIFGKVTSCMDVVDKIAEAPTGPNDRPNNPVKIISAAINPL